MLGDERWIDTETRTRPRDTADTESNQDNLCYIKTTLTSHTLRFQGKMERNRQSVSEAGAEVIFPSAGVINGRAAHFYKIMAL